MTSRHRIRTEAGEPGPPSAWTQAAMQAVRRAETARARPPALLEAASATVTVGLGGAAGAALTVAGRPELLAAALAVLLAAALLAAGLTYALARARQLAARAPAEPGGRGEHGGRGERP